MFYGSLSDRIALTEILSAPGGERLSRECAQICAVLLMEKNQPHYRGDKREKREFPRTSPAGIVKSLNKCHSVNQGLIGDMGELRSDTDRRLRRIKLVLGTLNVFLGTVAAVLGVLRLLK